MCGIAGIVARRPLEGSVVRAVLSSNPYRGPDGEGWLHLEGERAATGRVWSREDAVEGTLLLHRRLAIIDLSDAGHQPMASPDGRHWIVFNGEIYNHVELRRELEGLGHVFTSSSDTQVLLAAYRQWGRHCLPRLVGMFAFAVVDRDARRLFIARDPFGIKPLYWAHGDGGFAFASTIGTLLELPWVSRAADPVRVFTYLMTDSGTGSFGDRTMFRDVRQLPAAHFMERSLDEAAPPRPVAYWQPRPRRRRIDYPVAAARLRELFLENVRLHLRSDVPVGAALSGGIDSSAVVAGMRHVAGPGLVIRAFSFIPEEEALSEERWVDAVAAAAGAEVHKVRPDPALLIDELQRLIRVQEEPFGTTSIFAQYQVMRAASEAGVKVMLDGQGADELLAGYRHYIPSRIAALLTTFRWRKAWRLWRAALLLPGVERARLLEATAGLFVPPRARARLERWGLLGREYRRSWLNAEWFRGAVAESRRIRPRAGPRALRRALSRSLQETSLPGLLRYEDRNSMAFSIESRVPFLTPQLAEFLWSLPEEYLLGPDALSKRIFRDAMRGLVPDVVLERRDKIGFQTPEALWMRRLAPWVDEVLGSPEAQRVRALHIGEVRRQWAAIREGKAPYSSKVWRWVNLVEWTRRFGVTYD